MKKTLFNENTMDMMYALFLLGSVAAILGVVQAVKDIRRLHRDVSDERDEDILVYGAHV